MTTVTALLAGATGLVGGHLLDDLLASSRHSRVIAVTRRPLKRSHDKLQNLVVDFDALEDEIRAANINVDEAYCTLGTTIKKAGSRAAFRKVDFDYETAFARASREAGAKRFALVSVVGASTRSSIFLLRIKGETEEAMRAMGFPVLHIFQPGVLLGQRDEARPAEQLAIAATPLLNLGLQGPLRKYRGIAATDVAKAMLAALGTEGDGATHRYADMKKAGR